MPSDEAGGQTGAGWTPDEKGRGAPEGGDAGAAGEADPKAKTTDDRAATEAAAVKIEQENAEKEKSEGQPS
jgi:hypothetical protein